MNTVDELDRLYEEMTLTRHLVPGKTPPIYGYESLNFDWRWDADGQDYVYYNTAGVKHRIYGPAYTSRKYSIVEWWKDGKYHRIGGPAVEHKSTKIWYEDGLLHRLDGPALISKKGPRQYWIRGQKLSPKEYKKEIARRIRKGLIK